MYLFIFKEGKGGRKQGREILMCEGNIDWLPLACPKHGLGCNPGRCSAWELTFHFAGQSASWAMPVRVRLIAVVFKNTRIMRIILKGNKFY